MQADTGLDDFDRLSVGTYFAPVQVPPPGAAERYHVMWIKQPPALHRTTFFALALLFTLAACDSTEEDVVPAFSGTVLGDISASFSGIPEADRVSFDQPSGEQWTTYDFYFNGADSVYSASISLFVLDGTIQARSYPILPNGVIPPGNASASFGIREAPNLFRGFSSRGGTFTITRVSGDHVEGRFEFSASNNDPGHEVEIEGEFEVELTARGE